MPRSTMIFPIVLLCIWVDLLSFIGSLSNEICHFPRFFRGQRHQLAAYLFALEKISHIMAPVFEESQGPHGPALLPAVLFHAPCSNNET